MNIAFPSSKKRLRNQLNRNIKTDPKPRTDFRALRDSNDLQEKLTEKLDEALTNTEAE